MFGYIGDLRNMTSGRDSSRWVQSLQRCGILAKVKAEVEARNEAEVVSLE